MARCNPSSSPVKSLYSRFLPKSALARVSSRLAGVSGSAHPGFKLCGIRLWIWQSTHIEDRVRIDAIRRFMRETEGGELHAQAARLWWRTRRHPRERSRGTRRDDTARCVGAPNLQNANDEKYIVTESDRAQNSCLSSRGRSSSNRIQGPRPSIDST